VTRADLALTYCMAFDPALHARAGEEPTAKGGVVAWVTAYHLFAARALDRDPAVAAFRYRAAKFRYWHPDKLKEAAGTIDFDVTRADGSRLMLCVCPEVARGTPAADALLEGVEVAAGEAGAEVAVWTEIDLFGDDPAYARALLKYVFDKTYLKYAHEDTAGGGGAAGGTTNPTAPPPATSPPAP
jgi:hypothetical protein